MKGLVLGVFTQSSGKQKDIHLHTDAFEDIDKKCKGRLTRLLESTGPFYSSVKSRTFWVSAFEQPGDNLDCDCIVIVDLGSINANENSYEDFDVVSENVRCAIADGIRVLKTSSKFDDIYLDDCGKPIAVGESAIMTLFVYDELKQESSRRQPCQLHLYMHAKISDETKSNYARGLIFGESQNFSRYLQETPANLMTPTIFSNTVQGKVEGKGVEVFIRDKEWIESKKMGSFLCVARGSYEEPKFLELHYNGAPDVDKCIILVGKGVTFDSGGISLKPSQDMNLMRADMGGAACVVSAFFAVSTLGLKINLKVFTPLTDNMPDGKAVKPGDVVFAMNGKSIQVDNTDAEGRLILCDALCYAQEFNPVAILDFATLTGAGRIALGSACACVFTRSDDLWNQLFNAGKITGDRVWRMPLYKHYSTCVTNCQLADVNNVASSDKAGACTAAAFLQEFVKPGVKWLHADISCVKDTGSYHAPYFCKGFTGRPTRTIIQFLETVADNFFDF